MKRENYLMYLKLICIKILFIFGFYEKYNFSQENIKLCWKIILIKRAIRPIFNIHIYILYTYF